MAVAVVAVAAVAAAVVFTLAVAVAVVTAAAVRCGRRGSVAAQLVLSLSPALPLPSMLRRFSWGLIFWSPPAVIEIGNRCSRSAGAQPGQPNKTHPFNVETEARGHAWTWELLSRFYHPNYF